MNNKYLFFIFFLFFTFCGIGQQKSIQEKLFENATGDDLNALKHEDKFTDWEKLEKLKFSDPTIFDETHLSGLYPYVYFRRKICTTIINKKVGTIAHPMATIEIKAPDNIEKYGSQGITGHIIIVGKKATSKLTESQKVELDTEIDMTEQLFFISSDERTFSIDIPLNYYVVLGGYLYIKEKYEKTKTYIKIEDIQSEIKKQIQKKIGNKGAVMGVRG